MAGSSGLGSFLGKLVENQMVQAGAEQLARNLVDRAAQGTKPEEPAIVTPADLAAAIAPLATREQLALDNLTLRHRLDRQGLITTILLAAVLAVQLAIVVVLLIR